MTSADLPDKVEYGLRCGDPGHATCGTVTYTGTLAQVYDYRARSGAKCWEPVTRRVGAWLPVDADDTGQVAS